MCFLFSLSPSLPLLTFFKKYIGSVFHSIHGLHESAFSSAAGCLMPIFSTPLESFRSGPRCTVGTVDTFIYEWLTSYTFIWSLSNQPRICCLLHRILFGRLRSKAGSKFQGKASAASRSSIILRFLAGCQAEELGIFIDLLLEPVCHHSQGRTGLG